MNKRTGKLIALLAVLAVAVAAYFVASAIAKREQNRNDTPDETKISIIDKETTDLVSVTVKATGSDYTIAQSGGKYTLKDDADFPLDQDRAKDIAAAVTSVSADRRVAEAGADSSEYGLDSPLYTVTAKYSGGAEMTFRIGSYNRHTDSYYMSIAGEDAVYLVGKTMTSPLGYTMKELIVNETLIEPDEKFKALTAVKVDFSDGTGFRYSLVPGKTAESGDGSEDTGDTWALSLLDGTAIKGDFSKEAEALYDTLFGYKPTDWVAYGVKTDEQLKEYGLDAPYAEITVYYNDTVVITPDDSSAPITKTVEKTLTVRIGSLVPAESEPDGETGTSEPAESGTTAEIGETEGTSAADNDAPDSETAEKRYFIFDSGKIVYISKLSDLSAVLELPEWE